MAQTEKSNIMIIAVVGIVAIVALLIFNGKIVNTGQASTIRQVSWGGTTGDAICDERGENCRLRTGGGILVTLCSHPTYGWVAC